MDDFDRDVVCIGGLPFDMVDEEGALELLCHSARDRKPLFLSTPNLNFLMASQADQPFRDSVVHSDLSVADGMPIVWLGRLLGLPIRQRVAGSSLFEALHRGEGQAILQRPLGVYFFGGPPGAAEQACRVINETSGGAMICTGFESPGFGSIEEMSSPAQIDAINRSGADFLVVALGARKGQAWIEHNREKIRIPIISHLGAVVNFVAGTVDRAPPAWQRLGLEWLWRIKEEPSLFRRYFNDGIGLMGLLFLKMLRYALWQFSQRQSGSMPGHVLVQEQMGVTRITLAGGMTDDMVAKLRPLFRSAVLRKVGVALNLSGCGYLGGRFLGLLLMLKKQLGLAELPLVIEALSDAKKRVFRWNGLDYLLEDCEACQPAAPAGGQRTTVTRPTLERST